MSTINFNNLPPYYGLSMGGDWRTQLEVYRTKDAAWASRGNKSLDPGGAFTAWLKLNRPDLVSYQARKKIAEQYGIKNYKGDLDQNMELWKRLKMELSKNSADALLQTSQDSINPITVSAVRPLELAADPSYMHLIGDRSIVPINVHGPALTIHKNGGLLINYFKLFKNNLL